MLVLARKDGETVHLIANGPVTFEDGETIAVVLMKKSENRVARVGFNADRKVRFVRTEIMGKREVVS